MRTAIKAPQAMAETAEHTAASLQVWTDANRRVMRELTELSAAGAHESVRLYGRLAQTFAEVAGVAAPGAEGNSLVPLFTNPSAPWRSDFLIEHTNGSTIPTYCAVRTVRYIYVFYSTGERELYDLQQDPFELQKRASDPRYTAVLRYLRLRLRQLCNPPPPEYVPG